LNQIVNAINCNLDPILQELNTIRIGMSKSPNANDVLQTLSSKESSSWHPTVSVTTDLLHPELNRHLVLKQTSFPSKSLISTTLEPAHHLQTVQCGQFRRSAATRLKESLDHQIPHRQEWIFTEIKDGIENNYLCRSMNPQGVFFEFHNHQAFTNFYNNIQFHRSPKNNTYFNLPSVFCDIFDSKLLLRSHIDHYLGNLNNCNNIYNHTTSSLFTEYDNIINKLTDKLEYGKELNFTNRQRWARLAANHSNQWFKHEFNSFQKLLRLNHVKANLVNDVLKATRLLKK
jgi:hypothetical protein